MKTINYASTINNYFDNKLIHLQKLDRIREPINSSKHEKEKGSYHQHYKYLIISRRPITDNFFPEKTDNLIIFQCSFKTDMLLALP